MKKLYLITLLSLMLCASCMKKAETDPEVIAMRGLVNRVVPEYSEKILLQRLENDTIVLLVQRGAFADSCHDAKSASKSQPECPCARPFLPQLLHFRLHLALVGLVRMGALHRLDGAQWHQPALGYHRTRERMV